MFIISLNIIHFCIGTRGDQKCRFCLSSLVSSVCYNCPKDLFNNTDPYIYCCSECDERVHREKERKDHRVEAVNIRPGTSDATNFSKMELLSVICIETSHYVCYTRSGDKWLFHDSMADRLCKTKHIVLFIFSIL